MAAPSGPASGHTAHHASGSRLITWSPSVTLVPARGCFNACGYCSFRLPSDPADPFVGGHDPQEAVTLLRQRPEALEVLLLSGEVAPGAPERARWFGRLRLFCQLALNQGRLPHTNAGPLSRREMASLARLNGSMGLMLEGLGPAYDALHQRAPSKRLARRLEQLELAGRLGIPFTTGLLLGLGETASDRRDALELLAQLQRRWGHIQEVILQPWRAGPDPLSGGNPTPEPLADACCDELLRTIAEARAILPPEVHLQLPPNLWPARRLIEALEAGINDLGGIDIHDVINPAYPQPRIASLAATLETAGYQLRPRLCVHDAWIPRLSAPLRHAASVASARLRQASLTPSLA
ncbi:MAG: 7,8-didemethyl-8-hydroxy-5-deazariboflavin synthase subunit CofG [Synechococcaceae cyanobacterium]|nr:7,8-didemethyl-8-hydroxy-5-deazariboflavin synthase subunit CofG [Synechococcaceae cyanobacterium]